MRMLRQESLIAPTYVTTPSIDGRFKLRLRVLVPEDGVGNGAAIVGPVYSNTVRNSWGRWSVFQQVCTRAPHLAVLCSSTGFFRV
jgi:hypothetical protein